MAVHDSLLRSGLLSRLLQRGQSAGCEAGVRVIPVPGAGLHLGATGGGAAAAHYRGNRTSTTKYTLLTFLPKSLFEQYRRVANIYFTINAALSLTPYSPVRPWTTFLPLGLVLGIAMIKEAIEDYKRYRQDVEVNNRRVEVFHAGVGDFVAKTWADVRVGDVIMVYKDEFFPADLLFLSAGSEDGLCYIETMQLDGETNLKIKKAPDETKHLNAEVLRTFQATVRCEPPNSRLYHFTGNLEMPSPLSVEPMVVPAPPAAVLLRGCSLRNTSRIYGLVIYAGHDTKIFMNSTQPPSKRSQVERTVDRIIFFMFSLLFCMCLVGCITFASWTARHMPAHWYLGSHAVPREYDPSQPVIVGVTNFITSFILYSYLIPISLYVSIEIVKVVQAFVFIGRDREMYHADTDTPAVARTSNLNEELGMVNTVLTDKTGTLTCNVMEFFKASIGGVSYGAGVTEIERANAARRGVPLSAEADAASPVREQYFNFYDERIMGGEWAQQPNPQLAREFFRMLALCHTVIPDGPPNPSKIRYEAESPDEAALVVAAKVFGFFFFKRTNTTLMLRETLPEGVVEAEYEVLNILEFNSTRKRMSVVLRAPDNRILLYCKGADTVIYERLAVGHPTNEALRDVTLEHMEDYGSAGLRTLCLAFKELDTAFYDEWQERYIDAKTSLEDRQAKVDEVSEEIERDLLLLGCTAIEDKLQDGVPACIKALADANIRLWVLTGDKMETAINISYACSLVTDEMTQFQVTGYSPEVEELERQGLMEDAMLVAGQHVQSDLERVARVLEEDAAAKVSVKYALVIDGKALLYALSPMLRGLFLQVGLKCAAVVCCRVSPLQKAQVTALVKSHGDVTLAIGDGANDVGMIQKAHIGVGISGQEGMQAVMASDFAIAQFRFLTPLLLVHGRLSYKRITRMIQFFFYKNLLFGVTIFVYNAFALFSGQPIYNDFYMTMFNVVFTASAPLVVGWFDRDLDKRYGTRFPLLYREGQQNLYFNLPAIGGWLGTAVMHALLILTTVMPGAGPMEMDRATGTTLSLDQQGVLMFSIVIITVHLQLGSVIDHWTWMHHASCWGSVALWFMFLLVYGALPVTLASDLHKLFSGVVGNAPFFWLTVLIVPGACVLPTFAARTLQRFLRPVYYQLVQEVAARERAGDAVFAGEACRAGGGAAGAPSGLVARASRLMSRKSLKAVCAAAGGGGKAAVELAHAGQSGQLCATVPRVAVGGQQLASFRRRYSGFVAPYEARSRVFDANELRASAAAAGYAISSTGEIIAPPAARSMPGTLTSTLSFGRDHGHTMGFGGFGATAPPGAAASANGGYASGLLGASGGSGGATLLTVSASGAVTEQVAAPGSPGSPGVFHGGARGSVGPMLGARALGRALSGINAPGAIRHRRVQSVGANPWGASGILDTSPPPLPGRVPGSSQAGGATGAPAAGTNPLEPAASVGSVGSGGARASSTSAGLGLRSSDLARVSLGATGYSSGSNALGGEGAGDEATYASNPVLALLEREFSKDPRRHRHGVKLSLQNVPRVRTRSPKGKGSRCVSPAASRGPSMTTMRTVGFASDPGSLSGSGSGAATAAGGGGGAGGGSTTNCPPPAAAARGGEAHACTAGGDELGHGDGSSSGGGCSSSGGGGNSGLETASWAGGLQRPQRWAGLGDADGAAAQADAQQQQQPPAPNLPACAPLQGCFSEQRQQLSQSVPSARAHQPLPPIESSRQGHRPGGAAPSRLLRMAVRSDPPPEPAPVPVHVAPAAPRGAGSMGGTACSAPSTPASVGTHGSGASAGAAAALQGSLASVAAAPEILNEDPSMLRLYSAALAAAPGDLRASSDAGGSDPRSAGV